MEITSRQGTDIKDWGIDANPENDPTYPMKHRTNEEQKGYSWTRPTQQDDDVEVLQSIERPNLSAVIGTSTPPSGISGMLRRVAFQYSESSYGHWLPLMLADRINVVEGYIEDLSHGHIPNVFAERGWKAEWEHNRTGLLTKVAAGVAVTTLLVAAISASSNHSRRRRRYW